MTKIKFTEQIPKSKKVKDLEIGQAFVGRMGFQSQPVEVLLRMYSGVVSLTNPGRTWDQDCCMNESVLVYEYRPVDLEIIVKEIS